MEKDSYLKGLFKGIAFIVGLTKFKQCCTSREADFGYVSEIVTVKTSMVEQQNDYAEPRRGGILPPVLPQAATLMVKMGNRNGQKTGGKMPPQRGVSNGESARV